MADGEPLDPEAWFGVRSLEERILSGQRLGSVVEGEWGGEADGVERVEM